MRLHVLAILAMTAALGLSGGLCRAAGPGGKPTPAPTPTPLPPYQPIPGGPGSIGGGVGGVTASVGDGPAPGNDVIDEAANSRARFEKLMDKVNDCYLHGKYYDAVQALNLAGAMVQDLDQSRQVKTACLQLDAVGQEWLKKYTGAYVDKNYVEALDGLGLLKRTFNPLPSAVVAARLLTRIESDPQVRTALQEVKAQEIDNAIAQIINCPVCLAAAAASTAPASGPAAPPQATGPAAKSLMYADASRVEHVRKLPADRQFRVVAMLENMVKLYPDAPIAAGAIEDLKAIRDDKELGAALQKYATEQQAQGLYNAAEMYRRNGMNAKALEYYQQVTVKFPDTPLAAKAKDMMAKLQH